MGIVKAMRQDFMESRTSSKGTFKDPLLRQRPGMRRTFSDKEIDELYAGNWLFQNIIDIPAEDATREWIDIKAEQKGLREALIEKLRELKAREVFQEAIRYERLRGDGFIAIGARERGQVRLEQPIPEAGLIDIDYLHSFSRIRVKDANINGDPFSPDYGRFENYLLAPIKAGDPERTVHASRILHFQSRSLETEKWGIPLITTLADVLTIADNIAWSTGQVIYSLVFKVLKSPDIDIESPDKTDRTELQQRLEYEFNTMTLALIGEDDTLEFAGAGKALPSMKEIYDFVWDLIAGAARMPKSHIMGQQQGTITGAQYDSLNYYSRIASQQERILRPKLEYLIRLLLRADNGIGGAKVPDTAWELKFNPLWHVDSETDAKIRKLNAEIDQIYADIGALGPDEIRERRFGEEAVYDALDIDEAELKDIAAKVEQARREARRDAKA